MSDTQKTFADIIAEMKREAAKIFPALPIAVLKLATRLEAAHRRECELTKPAENVISVAASDSRDNSGNGAKLREALMKCQEITLQWQADERLGVAGSIEKPEARSASDALIDIEFVANAALDAPPRNCDKVKTSWDVLKKWHEGLDTANDIVRMLDWLLAPATEKEGGAK